MLFYRVASYCQPLFRSTVKPFKTSIVQHHASSSISVNIKLYTDHVMLYNSEHTEDIDQCVPVSSTIRILSDIRMRVQ